MSEDPTNADSNPVLGHGDMSSKPPPSVFMVTKSIDSRIAPEDATYTAPTGASSITYSQSKLLQVNESVFTYNVTPPSAGTVVQKAVTHVVSGFLTFVCQFSSTKTPASGQAWPLYGKDFAIAKASPLNAMVSNWQVQINNATVQWNNQGFDDLVHLMETPTTRVDKGVTTRTPMFTTWDDADETLWGLGSVADLQGRGDVPPGAYAIAFVSPDASCYVYAAAPGAVAWTPLQGGTPVTAGTPLAKLANLMTGFMPGTTNPWPLGSVMVYSSQSGAPGNDAVGISWQANAAIGQPIRSSLSAPETDMNFGLQFVMVDTLQCPPFGWQISDSYKEQGMWGINNMLITAQLTDPGQARWLQGTQKGGLVKLQYSKWKCAGATLWFTYLSPSTTNLEVLPPRCVVPLMYKQVTTYVIDGDLTPPSFNPVDPLNPIVAIAQVPSYTFSQVSDIVVVSVRPQFNAFAAQPLPFYLTDFCAAFPSQAFSQFQYANIPGILSNLAANQLVAICRKNGVKASVAQFGGLFGNGTMMNAGLRTAMGGAPIVLRPGTDFALPIGIAPGSMGNIQLQFTIQYINQSSTPLRFVVTTMSLSSAFFVLDNGAARQVMVGLNSKTLYDAEVTIDSLATAKFTGGGLMSTLSSFAGKAWRHRKAFGKVLGAAKEAYGTWKGDKGGGGPYAMAGAGYAGGAMRSLAGAKRSRSLRFGGAVDYADPEEEYGEYSGGAAGGAASGRRGSLLEQITQSPY